MPPAAMQRQLRRAARHRQSVNLTLAHSDEKLHGFPLSVTSEFVVIGRYYEWQFDGWAVVPLNNLSGVRSGKFERAAERILEAEGITRRLRPPPRLRLDQYETLFADVMKSRQFIQLETLRQQSRNRGSNEKTFLIGPVVAVSGDSLRVHNFDALGKWDRRPTEVQLDQVALVELGTQYAAVWSRHLPRRPRSDTQSAGLASPAMRAKRR